MRLDIPEGAKQSQMPLNGRGRIYGKTRIQSFGFKEFYVTRVAHGLRYFVAWAKYDGKNRTKRFWIQPAE